MLLGSRHCITDLTGFGGYMDTRAMTGSWAAVPPSLLPRLVSLLPAILNPMHQAMEAVRCNESYKSNKKDTLRSNVNQTIH